MQLNLRVMREEPSESSSEGEDDLLHKCFSSAPGVLAINSLQEHLKGGYSVSLEYNGAVDELLRHVKTSGFLLVF